MQKINVCWIGWKIDINIFLIITEFVSKPNAQYSTDGGQNNWWEWHDICTPEHWKKTANGWADKKTYPNKRFCIHEKKCSIFLFFSALVSVIIDERYHNSNSNDNKYYCITKATWISGKILPIQSEKITGGKNHCVGYEIP